MQLDIPKPTADDTKDVNSILTYFLGLLLIILVFVIGYLVKQNKIRFDEKDLLITNKDILIKEKDDHIKALYSRLDKEIEYMKSLASLTSGVVSDSTNALKTAIKELDKLGVEVPSIKNVVVNNNEVMKDIKDAINNHIINDRNTDK